MNFDFEHLRKNAFFKWVMTIVAVWKFLSFIFAIPMVWSEPIPLANKSAALAIGAFISLALCIVAWQFWRK